jgi:hypothetical protein
MIKYQSPCSGVSYAIQKIIGIQQNFKIKLPDLIFDASWQVSTFRRIEELNQNLKSDNVLGITFLVYSIEFSGKTLSEYK